jgi:predicted phosphodiesterase
MKIGLMSDSHDHRKNIQIALNIFRIDEVNLIIHDARYETWLNLPKGV